MTGRLVIRRPDDWHLHLRDGAVMAGVIRHSASHIGRALIMPNLVPPVVTCADASAYFERISAELPDATTFEPRMTLYLTENTDPADVARGAASGLIRALKLYPAGATTNSDSGVRDFDKVTPVLETMAEIGLPLCVHGEVTDPEVDIFDREAVFIERVLDPVRKRVSGLRVVMEHVTTRDGVDYVRSEEDGLAATLTTHHLMLNRNDLLVGGIRPHYYCLPILKREEHRLALRAAAVSGDPRFFSGTDSAPHVDPTKETACGCAGCFTAVNNLPCLAHVFEEEDALDKLEGFVSRHGAAFYGEGVAPDTITLTRSDTPAAFPDKIPTGAGDITVFDPGHPIYWQIEAP
ncbi:MAG: dihydroorotase [Pseudomonadota bacterium]